MIVPPKSEFPRSTKSSQFMRALTDSNRKCSGGFGMEGRGTKDSTRSESVGF